MYEWMNVLVQNLPKITKNQQNIDFNHIMHVDKYIKNWYIQQNKS